MSEPYYERDHGHCWEKDDPPCGVKGKHRCCLCKKPAPSTVEEIGEWMKKQPWYKPPVVRRRPGDIIDSSYVRKHFKEFTGKDFPEDDEKQPNIDVQS